MTIQASDTRSVSEIVSGHETVRPAAARPPVEFRTSPSQYRHWRLEVDGPVATLIMEVDEQGGLVPGYELKLNSYDLGVDIELYDALTGLEANYRFAGPETMETKIFGRLTAWQNWIFYRPNASGPDGALRAYGTGKRADFDRKRV